MIIWLGSYPRSGIAALRFILNHCFGLSSYSLEGDFLDRMPEQAARAGYVAHGLDTETFVARAQASDDIYVTKTFSAPFSGERAIYLVRDGRAAIYSYWTLLNGLGKGQGEARPEPQATLEEVVVGRTRNGCWSEHVEDWLMPGSNLMFLKYEELIEDDRDIVVQMAEFLGRDPIRGRYLEALPMSSASHPLPYEHNDIGIAEIMRRCPDLFEAAHGPMLRQLGYEVPLSAPILLKA